MGWCYSMADSCVELWRNELVVTDLLMPEKEGLETIFELTEHSPGVKIIAITGGGMGLGDDLLEMAKDFGAQRALRKPFSMKELSGTVEELLRLSS